MTLKIVPYEPAHASQVEQLVLAIQRDEFGLQITLQEQTDLQNVEKFFRQGQGNFWVAVQEDKVVGTIGLVDIGNQQFVLRKMFVDREFRGKEKGVGLRLLQTAIDWASERGFGEIILGTFEKTAAAQRFYEKNGFVKITEWELPRSFPRMAVDTVFYSRSIDPHRT